MKKLLKKKILIYLLLVIGFTSILSSGCSKDGDTEQVSTLQDVEGNTYHTITIGTQVWMVENLKTTKYNDSTPIPNLTEDSGWATDVKGAYCNYENNESYVSNYGRLYNGTAVNTGKLAPKGWHVPSCDEWRTMIAYLGGEAVAGGKSKAISSSWSSPNTGATNESGFTALPGGARFRQYTSAGYYSHYSGVGKYGYWWCSDSEDKGSNSYIDPNSPNSYRYTEYDSSEFTYLVNPEIQVGCSVRCVKD